MANEFVAKNGIIAKANSAITGTLDVSGNITMGTALVATRSWVTGTALSGYATESYVTTAINNLIDAAPGTLDTLNELAAALGDDPNFATTVTNSIATKLPLAGGTMTGNISWNQTDRGLVWDMNTDGAYIKFFNTGDGDANSRLEYATSDNGNEYHRWVVAGTEKMNLKWAGLTVADSIWMGGNLVATQSWVGAQGYLTSYSETDTLATVTARGNATTGNITVNGDLNFTGVLKYGGTTVISNSASDVYLNARVLYSTSTLNDGMYINYNTNGGAGAHLRFFANTTNERMRIDASTGNVGIGTQGPGKKLDVVGTIRAQVTSPGAGNGDVYGFNIHEFNGDNNRLGIGLHDTGDAFISLMSDLGTITRVDSNGSSYFMGGNVGVGTTNPSYKLDVIGNARIGQNSNSSTAASLQITSGGNGYDAFIDFGYWDTFDAGIWNVGRRGSTGAFFISDYSGGPELNRLTITTAGNVGIGTTSPSFTLSVQGIAQARGGVYVTQASPINTLILNANDTALHKIYTNSSVDLSLGTNSSTSQLYLKNGGNVGIGTTSPGAKLDVSNGNIRISNGYVLRSVTSTGSVAYPLIGMQTDTVVVGSWEGNFGTNLSLRGGNGAVIADFSQGNNSFFAVRGVAASTPYEYLRVTASGNVGIGTTAPTVPLHIVNTNATISMTNSSAFAVDTGSRIFLGGKYSSGTSNNTSAFAWLVGAKENATDGNQAGYLSFTTTENGGGFAERMRITSTGNVGIGTTSPSVKLDIETASGWSGLDLNGASGGEIRLQKSGTTYGQIYASDSTALVINGASEDIFQVAGSEKMRITSSGNVLIGTTTDSGYKLNVNGSLSTTYANVYDPTSWSVVNIAASSVGVSASTHYSPYGTLSGTNPVFCTGQKFSEQGSYSIWRYNGSSHLATDFVVNNAGNVGIGTTSPSHKLTVSRATEAAAYQININNDGGISNGNFTGIRFSQDAGGTTELGNIKLHYYSTGATDLSFGTRYDTQAIYIKNGGNVGIGNSSPTAKLQVGPEVHQSATGIEVSAGAGGANLLAIDESRNHNWFPYTDGRNYYSAVEHTFRNEAHSTNWMKITSSGTVGIGTNDPLAKLDVRGDILAYYANVVAQGVKTGYGISEQRFCPDGGDKPFVVYTSADFTNERFRITSGGQVGVGSSSVYHGAILSVAGKQHFQSGSNSDIGGAIYSTWTQNANGTDYYAGDLRFQIFNASTGTYGLREAMMIDGKGYVGINTLTPSSHLQVVGVITATGGNSTNWNTAYGWGNHATYDYWVIGDTDAKSVASTSVRFQGDVEVQGTLTESSSIRFKENIKPLEPALDKVEQLNPVTYNKIGVAEEEIGLIAEEVAELFPEVVTYNEEGQPSGIQYQRLSVILLKAVQELTDRVNKLENK